MAYRCDQAIIGRAEDPIRCKVSGTICAHQKMCLMEGRIVLTDESMRCPARDGKLPEAEPVTEPEKPETEPEKKPAKKASGIRRKAK